VATAVHVIVDHYERRGDQALLMLAQERHQELMGRLTQQGKAMHRAWVEEVFAPFLDEADDAEALTDLLVVATDVYTWKLLRRDRRLGRDRTERRMRHLVDALLASPPTT
jgi:predicted acylesterase/phospholipase RssA